MPKVLHWWSLNERGGRPVRRAAATRPEAESGAPVARESLEESSEPKPEDEESGMREIGKTKAANVLIAAGCLTVAAIAFHLHSARAEDPGNAPGCIESIIPVEQLERTLPSRDGKEADAHAPARAVVLTCRLEDVSLTSGLYKD